MEKNKVVQMKKLWQWALTHTLSRITLSKVSFSDLLGNDFLDHPDTFEQIFDFYTFDIYTFKNHTFESVWVSARLLSTMYMWVLYFKNMANF